MQILAIKTTLPRDAVDITDAVNEALTRLRPRTEMAQVFVRHTTAALTTAPIRTEKGLDLLGAMETMLCHPLHPGSAEAHTHHTTYAPPYVLAALIGSSLSLPLLNGQCAMGTFQRIVLLEFEGPGVREVVVSAP